MQYAHLSAEDKARFWEDGYLIKRRYFDDEEIGLVRRALVEDATLHANIIDREEAFGGAGSEWEASDNLVQIHITEERVLIAVDSAKGRNLFPDFRDMEVNNQLRVMRILANLEDVDVVLPGHGPITTQDAFIDYYDYLFALKENILGHMRDGRTLQEIKTLSDATMREDFGDYNGIDRLLEHNIVTMWDYLYRYREPNARITQEEATLCIQDSRQCRTD